MSGDPLPVGTLRLDESLVVLEASPRLLADFECAADEVEGVELTELIAARDRRSTTIIDRGLARAKTERIDLLATFDLGPRQRLTRLLLSRREGGWTALVECIEVEGNTVHELFTQQRRWSMAIKEAAEGFVFLDAQGRIVDQNARFVELVGVRSQHGVLLTEEVLAGRPLVEFLDEGHAPLVEVLAGLPDAAPRHAKIVLGERHLELDAQPVYLPPVGFCGHSISLRDVSDRVAAERERAEREAERRAHHEQVIAAQRAAIRSLSAPRIPISPELTVVPLVGELDGRRMAEITEDLLRAVSRAGTRTIVLDLTGVPTLELAGVGALLSAARSLRLLGIRSMLTGVSPALARSIVELSDGVPEFQVCASLEAAIAATMGVDSNNRGARS